MQLTVAVFPSLGAAEVNEALYGPAETWEAAGASSQGAGSLAVMQTHRAC